jgi:hypothetical protein
MGLGVYLHLDEERREGRGGLSPNVRFGSEARLGTAVYTIDYMGSRHGFGLPETPCPFSMLAAKAET